MSDFEPFTFIAAGKAYRVLPWGADGKPWLFYWHDHAKNWVSLREATTSDMLCRRFALNPETAAAYDAAEDRARSKK